MSAGTWVKQTKGFHILLGDSQTWLCPGMLTFPCGSFGLADPCSFSTRPVKTSMGKCSWCCAWSSGKSVLDLFSEGSACALWCHCMRKLHPGAPGDLSTSQHVGSGTRQARSRCKQERQTEMPSKHNCDRQARSRNEALFTC